MERIAVVIGLDVETDVGSWTPFYKGVEKGIPILLDILARHEVRATFFFTGDVACRFPESTREVLRSGHEVGCHSLYHETVGDELFPIPGVKPLLPEEVPLRLQRATEAVAKAAGTTPQSFRAPRLWGSTTMVNALEELGYKVDATYPLFFHRDRLVPYHPSRSNWLEEGDSALLEIPIFADIARQSVAPYGRDLDQWPIFRVKGAPELMEMVARFVACVKAQTPTTPVLCFYFHPWEFIPLPGEFHYGEGTVVPDPFLLGNCGPEAVKQFELLIASLKRTYVVDFVAASALAEMYRR